MKSFAEIREEVVNKAGENPEFRARLLANPQDAIKETTGIEVPADVELFVHEESANSQHLVLPRSAQLSDSQLSSVSGMGVVNNQPRW